MLRKIRIGISVVLFSLITFFFLDFAGILPNSFHRLAHLQFIPALLSFSVGILIFLKSATPFPKCYLHKEKWTFDS